MGKKLSVLYCIIFIILIIAIIFISLSVKTVETNYVAIAYNSLTQHIDENTLYKEGVKMIGPFHKIIQYPTTYTTISYNNTNQLTCRSNDGLSISIEASFQYKIDATLESILYIYKNYGKDYERVYVYLSSEVIREVASKYVSFEYYNSTEKIKEDMVIAINDTFKNYKSTVSSFQLAGFTVPKGFSDENERTQSVIQQAEAIQYTKRDAEIKAKSDVIKSEEDAKIIILNGNATYLQMLSSSDTESSRIISEVNSETSSYSELKKELNKIYTSESDLSKKIMKYIWIENVKKRSSNKGVIDFGEFDNN